MGPTNRPEPEGRDKQQPKVKMSREQARNMTVKVPGVGKMKILAYIDYAARRLPPMLDENDQPMNHRKAMRGLLTLEGLDGVKAYITICNEKLEQAGPEIAKQAGLTKEDSGGGPVRSEEEAVNQPEAEGERK